MSPWIGSNSDGPCEFRELGGCEATVLAFLAAPHRTMIVAVRASTREDDTFIVLHGCRRIVAPIKWSVGSIDVARVDADTVVLSDSCADVQIECYGGRLLRRAETSAFFGDNPSLKQLIDEFC